MRTHRPEYLNTRVGSLSARAECLLHNAAYMRRKRHQRHSQAPQAEMAKVTAPDHPSIWTLIGSTDVEILKIAEQVYWGCVVSPSVLPCRWQKECIKELCHELAKCMARGVLQSRPGLARPTSRSRRYSYSHSASWAWSPSVGPQRWNQPNYQEKTPQQDDWGCEGDIPVLGVGVDQEGARVSHFNAQAGTSHPLLAPMIISCC